AQDAHDAGRLVGVLSAADDEAGSLSCNHRSQHGTTLPGPCREARSSQCRELALDLGRVERPAGFAENLQALLREWDLPFGTNRNADARVADAEPYVGNDLAGPQRSIPHRLAGVVLKELERREIDVLMQGFARADPFVAVRQAVFDTAG